MESVLDKELVLVLNKNWMALSYVTPRKALIALCGGIDGGTPPALALDIEVDENGHTVEPLSAYATKWEDWVKLPVRPGDMALHAKSGPFRCPTVLIMPSYSEMPQKAQKLTSRAILERDGYVDQYTGRQLKPSEASVDHVIPKDLGGKNTWFNMVCMEKKANHEKSNRRNREVGLRLIRKPLEPKPVPVSSTIKKAKHSTHKPFVHQ